MENPIEWLIVNHPEIADRVQLPAEELFGSIKQWVEMKTWSLFKSVKYGEDVLKVLVEYYSDREEY